jgi:hypothetical protein
VVGQSGGGFSSELKSLSAKNTKGER